MNPVLATALALLLDRVVGDPVFPPHPVVVMGRYIAWWDRRFNHPDRPGPNRWAGIALVVTGALLFGGIPLVGLAWLARTVPPLAWVIGVWLISTTIAWKSLVDAGRLVEEALAHRGLPAARVAVARIVGRDTNELDEAGVVRATVETLAENLVDAVVAPVLYACLAGAPGALVYRWVNTLDAMVGHTTPRHLTFGWASARSDDGLNFLPARLTAALMLLMLPLARLDLRAGGKMLARDGRRHPSPNSGLPEAIMAGALHVQLGGTNTYGGVASHRPPLGDPGDPLVRRHITRTLAVVNWSCASLLGIVAAMGLRP